MKIYPLHMAQEIFAFNWATLPMPQLLTRLGEPHADWLADVYVLTEIPLH